MLNNWFKKEKPFGGFAGFGGGATGIVFGGVAAVAAEATGGIINEYSDGGTKYKAHIFTTPGTFELVSGDVDLEYMVIGGGGSGGSYNGGAGGSGGGDGGRSGHKGGDLGQNGRGGDGKNGGGAGRAIVISGGSITYQVSGDIRGATENGPYV